MRLRALRTAGVSFLLALLAATAMTAEAATTHSTKTGKSSVSASKRTSPASTRKKHAHRRARRPPPGGVYARNAILIDPSTGEVLFAKNSDRSVPIASLTKLMTALVFLEQKPALDGEVEVTLVELKGGGHTQLRRGERVALGDLLHMSLMCSDNVATRVLARESGLSGDEFVARMNRKAVELGLTGSRFVEFTGLDERNVSSASDIARLLHAAANDPLIQEITTTRQYQFATGRRVHAVYNTNRLLYGRYEVMGGKTGFILEAGYCFATWIRTQGRDLIAVVLGAPTNATRFADAVRLFQKSTAPAAASSGT
jgi:D-alanyl-D-alanine endopeptidase (penicillin-binding protein 7)